MNLNSNRKIEIARTEEDMYEKLEHLQKQGYEESDIHVISSESTHLNALNRYSDVTTHEAGTFIDKFKSWFTGESAIVEGLKKLDLTEEEAEQYAKEVASGSIVLYTDAVPEGDSLGASANAEAAATTDYTDTVGTDVVQNRFTEGEAPISDYAKESGFTPSTNNMVNETDGRLDEPQDKFVRGETFATDPLLVRDENHVGHTMQEDKLVQNKRPTIEESITVEEKSYGSQSPGSDPNLGPAAFGDDQAELNEEERRVNQQQQEEKLERQKKLDEHSPVNRLY
ncbi:MAG: general stress protein [Psychrobacillus sp.]